MGFVGIDVEGARQVGLMVREASGDAEESRRQTMDALTLAELSSDVPQRLAKVADGLSTFGAGITQKADLAASFTVDPKGVAEGLNTPVEVLNSAISGLVGFSGPSDPFSHVTSPPTVPPAEPSSPVPPVESGDRFETIDEESKNSAPVSEQELNAPSDAKPQDEDLEATVFSEQRLAGPADNLRSFFTPMPAPDAVPGASLVDAPPGLPLFSPFAGAHLGVTILGDSFISGEGKPGEDGYVGLGSTYVNGVQQANLVHQSRDSGALLAVRDLQRKFPEAEIQITYTADEFNPETVAPLRPTLGPVPVINVTVAAESGADIDTILGTRADGTPARNHVLDSPSRPQIESVTKDTGIIMLSVGGNTRIREGDKEGVFASLLGYMLTPAIIPKWSIHMFNLSGADEARELGRGIWTGLIRLPELLHQDSARSASFSETLFAGYPYFINGFDENGNPLPLPAGLGWPFSNLESNPLPFPLNELNDEENRQSVQVWKQMTLVQATDAEFADILPGQRITYLPQNWDNKYTLTGSTPAVNGWVGPKLPPHDPRMFHPNGTGQDLYRQLFRPGLEAATDRIWGPRPEALSAFDSFGQAAELLQRSTTDLTTVNWDSPELTDGAARTELPGLSVAQGGLDSGKMLPPGLYGALSPATLLLSNPELFSSPVTTGTTDSDPFASADPSWAGRSNAGLDDLVGSSGSPAAGWSPDSTLDNQWSDPVMGPLGSAGTAMPWDSGGVGDIDFDAAQMYSGESLIVTEGF